MPRGKNVGNPKTANPTPGNEHPISATPLFGAAQAQEPANTANTEQQENASTTPPNTPPTSPRAPANSPQGGPASTPLSPSPPSPLNSSSTTLVGEPDPPSPSNSSPSTLVAEPGSPPEPISPLEVWFPARDIPSAPTDLRRPALEFFSGMMLGFPVALAISYVYGYVQSMALVTALIAAAVWFSSLYLTRWLPRR